MLVECYFHKIAMNSHYQRCVVMILSILHFSLVQTIQEGSECVCIAQTYSNFLIEKGLLNLSVY